MLSKALALVAIVLVVLEAVAAPAPASAQGLPSFSVSPQTTSTVVGEVFNITLVARAGSSLNPVSCVSLTFDYNQDRLQAVDNGELPAWGISPGSAWNQVPANSVDHERGRITFSATRQGSPYPSGTFTIATITFRAIAPGTASLTFSGSAGACTGYLGARPEVGFASGYGQFPTIRNGSVTVSSGFDATPAPTATSSAPGPTTAPTATLVTTPTSAPLPTLTWNGTSICWTTGTSTNGAVWVSVDGGSQALFANAPSGCSAAPWVSPSHTFVFRLLQGSTVLATLTLQAVATATPTSTRTPSPSPTSAPTATPEAAQCIGGSSTASSSASPRFKTELHTGAAEGASAPAVLTAHSTRSNALTSGDSVGAQMVGGWTDITCERYDAGWPTAGWLTLDNNGPTSGDYCWGTSTFQPRFGSRSTWPAAGCANGVDPSFFLHPHNADSWMVYGPFSLENASAAEVRFGLWHQLQAGDTVAWLASLDGSDFWGWETGGSSTGIEPPTNQGWLNISFDLGNVFGVGSLLGQPSVWIAFRFASNGSGTDNGPFIDDVLVRRLVSTPTSTPTFTATLTQLPSSTPTRTATATTSSNSVLTWNGTSICWTIGNSGVGRVWVSVNGGNEVLFAESASGCSNAPWVTSNDTFVFRLMQGSTLLSTLTIPATSGTTPPTATISVAPTAAPPTATPASGAAISAFPNPVPSGSGVGTTTIIWTTGNGSFGQVWVSINGATEVLFTQGSSGASPAPWILSGVSYVFTIYQGTGHSVALGQITVTRTEASGTTDISADPNPVPAGSGVGTTTITWSAPEGSYNQVWVTVGGPNVLFAEGAPSSAEAPWIVAGNTYTFKLYQGVGHSVLLDQVTVTRVS